MAPQSLSPLNLNPAKWIWLPSQRTLANTFVLFRRTMTLEKPPQEAKGWILADSRYLLTVNGKRVQWGPAPAAPRRPEADPVDLGPYLRPGKNVVGVQVLHYGHGEGTWPFGKPGLIMRVQIGDKVLWTDQTWRCCVDRSHRPGQYRRWFLRALQEECDLRKLPRGWDEPDFEPGPEWREAQAFLSIDGTKPSFASRYSDYAGDSGLVDASQAVILPRSIPPMKEADSWGDLVKSGKAVWKGDPDDWFEFRSPGLFELTADPSPQSALSPSLGESRWAIFRMVEGMVGWPWVDIEAPEGTIVELMPHEAHDLAKQPWLDSGFYSWSRFVTRGGRQRLETFDFEALRWLQVHVRGAGPVTIHAAGVRRRTHPWPRTPLVRTKDEALQRLWRASLNTLDNSAQETLVDGMARERQQYSGDGGHQAIAVRLALGGYGLSARYIRTFSMGLAADGYFMDCWPAYDRLARIAQKQVGASYWGPILDHGVGFIQDVWRHWMHSGDLDLVKEVLPKLARFASRLVSMTNPKGLLPVENLGIPNVWMDHEAYRSQRDRQCAFTLYVSHVLRTAMAPLAQAAGVPHEMYLEAGEELEKAVEREFFNPELQALEINRPWKEDEEPSLHCDRSLATWILAGKGGKAAALLATMPGTVGRSYPANAIWRLWGLAKAGRIDVVLASLRQRWAPMKAVVENNTLPEFWDAQTDGTALWSHCPLGPLIILYEGILGLRPLEPGFKRVELAPQLGDLPDLFVDAQLPQGTLHFEYEGGEVRISSPVPGVLKWKGAETEIVPDQPLRA